MPCNQPAGGPRAFWGHGVPRGSFTGRPAEPPSSWRARFRGPTDRLASFLSAPGDPRCQSLRTQGQLSPRPRGLQPSLHRSLQGALPGKRPPRMHGLSPEASVQPWLSPSPEPSLLSHPLRGFPHRTSAASGPPWDTTPKLTPGSVHTLPAACGDGVLLPTIASPQHCRFPSRPTSSHTLVQLLGTPGHQPRLAISEGSLLSPRAALRAGWLRALPQGWTG